MIIMIIVDYIIRSKQNNACAYTAVSAALSANINSNIPNINNIRLKQRKMHKYIDFKPGTRPKCRDRSAPGVYGIM